VRTATFRFSGGSAINGKLFTLARSLRTGQIGPVGAPVLKVWPDIGRMDGRLAPAPGLLVPFRVRRSSAWRIDAPAPSEELLSDYREAGSASGVGWKNLAANGFANDRDHAIYRYNNANEYVQAMNDYGRPTPQRSPAPTVGTSTTTQRPVTCCSRPAGYAATSPIPVGDLANNAQ
jgi:hypothetical protein